MGDTRWHELDGEPATVKAKGRAYSELAEAISRSVGTLQQIVDDTRTTAKSMEATRKLAGEVREDIDKARDRYAFTGEALTTYGTALRSAKNEADPAAERLRTLRSELADAEAAARVAQAGVDDLRPDASVADVADARRAQHEAEGRRSEVMSDISVAESQWAGGHQQKETAARKAIERIDEVVTGDKVHGLKDSRMDKVKNVLKGVYKVFKIICDIAGILAIFLSWVPVLGQVLLVLAAIGAIIAIVENIVKFTRGEIGLGAMLVGVGLGLMALFGGKAISAAAKYAKARSVVQTAATMSNRAAKLKFGGAVLKSSRKIMGKSLGRHAWETLKSPFVRSAGDKAVAGMVKNGLYNNAFKSWQGAKFPLPYKDGAARFAVGNDDVVDMFSHFGQMGMKADGVASMVRDLATVGAVFNQAASLANTSAKLGTAIGGGDGWGMYSEGNSFATGPAGGDWGKITGLPGNVNNWVKGVDDIRGHNGYVAGSW